MNGRRSDDNGPRVHQGHRQFADIGDSGVGKFDPNVASNQSCCQMVDHCPGAAVHGDQAQHHQIVGLRQHPVATGCKNFSALVLRQAQWWL